MTGATPKLVGLVPDHLKVRSARIVLDSLEVQVDVGFHDFEVGTPQRLLVSAEIWLEDVAAPADDDPALAWNYDTVRQDVERICRRAALQPPGDAGARLVRLYCSAQRGQGAAHPHLEARHLSPTPTAWAWKSLPFEGPWPKS